MPRTAGSAQMAEAKLQKYDSRLPPNSAGPELIRARPSLILFRFLSQSLTDFIRRRHPLVAPCRPCLGYKRPLRVAFRHHGSARLRHLGRELDGADQAAVRETSPLLKISTLARRSGCSGPARNRVRSIQFAVCSFAWRRHCRACGSSDATTLTSGAREACPFVVVGSHLSPPISRREAFDSRKHHS